MNVASEKVINDLLKPIGYGKGFLLWMSFLTTALLVCLYAYSIQLKVGLGVTGLRDYVSWGIYIANFVFFVATSLIGMLISACWGLPVFIGQRHLHELLRLYRWLLLQWQD
ncbi:MAG: hypothetical protein ACP5PZ_08090 [Bacteroidales bacterium]